MTNQDAIKFLQQIYPNGGHCWLDEQRIEAIGMAIKALQEEPEREDLVECASEIILEGANFNKSWYAHPELAFNAGTKWQKTKDESTTEDLGDYINELSKQFPEVSFAKLSRIAVRVAKWQAEQMMAKAIDGKVIANGMGNPILHLWDKGRHFIDKKVKVILMED